MSAGAEALAALSDFTSGTVRIAIASDSTANDYGDWIPAWLRLYAAENPTLRVVSRSWDPVTFAYREPVAIQEGCPGRGVEVLNAAVAGSRLSLHAQHLAAMFPDGPIDLLVCASGHNYGMGEPAPFIAELGGFIRAYLDAHPESAVVLSSQNPQYEPAVAVEQHKARQAAVRRLAASQGWGYVPTFEAFANHADGHSLIGPDGVHPLPTGADFWAQVWQDEIDARRVR